MIFLHNKKVSHKVQLNLSFHVRAQFEMDGVIIFILKNFFIGKEMYESYDRNV